MKKIISIIAFSFALFFAACDNNSTNKAGTDVNANTQIKTDVKDAQNTAAATQDGKCQGTRAVGCTCPQGSNPVCGCNGVTYNNGCEAECDGVVRYTFGACPTSGTGGAKTTSAPR